MTPAPVPEPSARILVVEDSEDDMLLLRSELAKLGRPVEVHRVESAPQMDEALASGEWDLVISDHQLPQFDAIRAFELLRRTRREVPFVIMSGTMPEETAATVMRLGANDFIDKSKPARLIPVIERELRQAKLRREKRDVEATLQTLTYLDTLTGLPNGRMLVDALVGALAARGPGAPPALLAVLNLDRFRKINETFGHDAGDRLLQQCAKRLARALPGASAARLAQDRFAVFVPALDAVQDPEGVARAIADAVQAPFDLAGQPVFLSCTCGYCVVPVDGADAGTLLHRAEAAMFEAKRAGIGSLVRYDPDPRRIGAIALLEQDLRLAIPRGQLVLNYQPFIALADESVVGCEALVRWNHPKLGLLPPDRFIPLADETGLIQALGTWVIGEAVHASRSFREAGLALPVAINVSAVQFRRPGFADDVAQALAREGLSGDDVAIEITETVLMDDADATIRTLRRLKDDGVRISVDDFGTGYSSLAYLKRFPIDVLKIDRSFVTGVHDDAESLAIVRTIVALGKTLKLTVVAEGVESRAQADFLRAMGCDRAQGYLYARPMAREALDAWRAARGGGAAQVSAPSPR